VDEDLVGGEAMAVAFGRAGFVWLLVAGGLGIVHESLEGFEGAGLGAEHGELEFEPGSLDGLAQGFEAVGFGRDGGRVHGVVRLEQGSGHAETHTPSTLGAGGAPRRAPGRSMRAGGVRIRWKYGAKKI
jgi:hypothetical protein